MIRKRPELDTTTPPGQVVYADVDRPRGRYLRDVIERIQKEEAREPLVSAEKRLEALVGALQAMCDIMAGSQKQEYHSVAKDIRRIIKENT